MRMFEGKNKNAIKKVLKEGSSEGLSISHTHLHIVSGTRTVTIYYTVHNFNTQEIDNRRFLTNSSWSAHEVESQLVQRKE